MKKNHSFLIFLKSVSFLFMAFYGFVAKGQTLVGQTVDALPGDAFTYQSQSMPNYGIKWTSDSWAPGGHSAWFSGYGGVKFFTAGARRFSISASGEIEASVPLIMNPVAAGSNYIHFRNNGTNLAVIGSSGSIYGTNPDDFGLYVYGGGNLEFSTGATKRMLIASNGNIGIGNANPQHKLDVSGYILSAPSSLEGGIYMGNINHGVKRISGTNDVAFYTTQGKLSLSANGESANHVVINNNGNVGIGTAISPSNYKLAVGGKIIAEELKVQPQSAWPDYVFKSTYKLTPLPELEKFIRTNQHLPEVPSAKEVAANGIEVGANQALLLKKIEEITLHLIELNKKVEQLQQENHELKKSKKDK